ncbi:MAG: PorT family protein [Mucilaginibacter sp.]|uniref:outer membrane beta-barrel protein n=1 Tax=Mucilaginibacter sp. TaxID=1882438 RepID=UPI003266D808
MKRLILAAIFCGMMGSLYAEQINTDTIKRDTTIRKKHVRVRIGAGGDTTSVSFGKKIRAAAKPKSGFSFGLTFTNLHLGFATLLDNGSFTLSPANDFLDYRQIKTSNVGFDLLKIGYRFNDNFKLSLAGGFDWTLIRLKKNINIVPDVPTLTYVPATVNYSKNRFSSNYLVLPLSFDIRTREYKDGKRFHFVFGPEAGFLIDGMQKQISDEYGKKKNFNDFHFTRFEYGGFARIAYGDLGIYAKYYFNDMFENSPAQKGLKNFNFGLVLGF